MAVTSLFLVLSLSQTSPNEPGARKNGEVAIGVKLRDPQGLDKLSSKTGLPKQDTRWGREFPIGQNLTLVLSQPLEKIPE